jgi:hypothetical protein
MKIYYTPFIKITFLSLIFFILTIIFHFQAPDYMVSEYLLLIVPFFYIVSIVSAIFYLRAEKKTTLNFKNSYLTSTGIKLGLYITILMLYGVFNKDDVIPFFISFLIFYLIYTFLDVKNLLRRLSK